uniref:Uncharacterized protein n=1 Tax=Rhizophora mucronata TaxID=61149 RepID=A0A2P2IYL5_RHIMU
MLSANPSPPPPPPSLSISGNSTLLFLSFSLSLRGNRESRQTQIDWPSGKAFIYLRLPGQAITNKITFIWPVVLQNLTGNR